MRRLFLTVLLLALILGTGCVHIGTIKLDEWSDIEMAWDLAKLLSGISRDWTYQRHVFDCTNMTAFLYDFLTSHGYDCEIVIGATYPWGFLTGKNHAWLIVQKHGRKFWIKSTTRAVAPPGDFKKYFLRIRLGSLENARKFYGILGLEGEWDY